MKKYSQEIEYVAPSAGQILSRINQMGVEGPAKRLLERYVTEGVVDSALIPAALQDIDNYSESVNRLGLSPRMLETLRELIHNLGAKTASYKIAQMMEPVAPDIGQILSRMNQIAAANHYTEETSPALAAMQAILNQEPVAASLRAAALSDADKYHESRARLGLSDQGLAALKAHLQGGMTASGVSKAIVKLLKTANKIKKAN